MITVNYRGQTGNCLTQYCYGRIVAQMTGQSFRAPGIRMFPQLATAIDGTEYGHGEITIRHNSSHHVLMSPRETADRIRGFDARLEGFFERAEWYLPYRDEIMKWIGRSTLDCLDRVAIHIRGGDGAHNSPPLEYYLQAIDRIGVSKMFTIFTDDATSELVDYFKKFKPFNADLFQIKSRDPSVDFSEMNGHGEIIIGNSTFAWWAAFLSSAIRVIQPEPLIGFRSKEVPNSYLHVPDWEQISY